MQKNKFDNIEKPKFSSKINRLIWFILGLGFLILPCGLVKANEENFSQLKEASRLVQIGDFNQAKNLTENVLSLDNDSQTKAFAWRILGNANSGMGEYQEAVTAYRESLKQEHSLLTFNNLVKTLIAKKDTSELTRYYASRAKKIADRDDSLSVVYAYINWVRVFQQYLDPERTIRAQNILEQLPPSRSLTYALINWGKFVANKQQSMWFDRAFKISSLNQDSLGQAHSLLELAKFQANNHPQKALGYLNRVIAIAQAQNYYELAYQAEYLAGDLYSNLKQHNASLTAYKNAIAALELLDKDLYASRSTAQITKFKENSNSVYQKAMASVLTKEQVSVEELRDVLEISNKLKLTELQKFFGDDCFEIVVEDFAERGNSQAVVSSIIFKDRTFLILQLPDGSISLSRVNISQSDLNALIIQWRAALTKQQTRDYYRQAKKLYDLIIRPIEPKLVNFKVETIVFAHDGILRNIPMAALHDGERYLVQRWASISSIGFKPVNTKVLKSKKLSALIFALSKPTQKGWTDLTGVETEVETVGRLFNTDRFINENFTSNSFFQQLDQQFYDIIHIATHGVFTGDVRNSFLLAYNSRLSIGELENSFRQQTGIDLLVLSACETAVSSDLSLLSLAGVAARSGVRTTLGSLWKIDDSDQGEVVEKFYQYWLSSDFDKAKALQKMQIDYIKQYSHPFKWATLNLIGEID